MKKKVTIVGGGACALLLACELDSRKFEITLYEKNATPGRKFLVAGDGGLNLSHSEQEADFLSRYTPSAFLEKAFYHFSNKHLVQWLNHHLNLQTYVGSSGRIFPAPGIKPVEVLNRFLEQIKKNNVCIINKHTWAGFSENGQLLFESQQQVKEIKSDIVLFCLGGASWPVTGSNGAWTSLFTDKNISIQPFKPSNCAFQINWPPDLIDNIEGSVLKNTAVTCNNTTRLGEMVLTRFGIEGSGIYPLSPQIRTALEKQGSAELLLDFKPTVSEQKLIEKIQAKPGGKNMTSYLKQTIHLSNAQIALVKAFLSKETFLDAKHLAPFIKQIPLHITAPGNTEDAISTVGGIALEELDEFFQLKKIPNHYAIGEMLDYDAPTGGYLLQSCFSMANYLAAHLNAQN